MQTSTQATIYDIARLAGVSIGTVSRVFNDKPDVSQKTKEKILALAEKYNFKPNESARTLATKKSKLIAVILPDVSNPHFTKMLFHICKLCEQNKYGIIFFDSDGDPESEKRFVQQVILRQADGLLIALAKDNSEVIPMLKNAPFPSVVMSRIVDGLDSAGIIHGNGSSLAADYLFSKGCEQFYYFGLETDEKYMPFKKRLLENKVAENNINVIGGKQNWYFHTREEGMMILKNFIRTKVSKEKTGLFCLNDLYAMTAVAAALESGIKIGSDMYIVGFDDTDLCNMIYPKLTSIYQPVDEIAQASFLILMRRIEEGKLPGVEPEHIIFEPKISIRGT